MIKTPQKNVQTLKYVSLITLTLQNALVGLSMRHAQTRPGDKFQPSTAVVMTEVVKCIICLILVLIEEGSLRKFINALNNTIVKQPIDTLKMQQLISDHHSSTSAITQNRLLGFSSVLGACFLSGFAGIYFEKILKDSDISVWMRNVQLSMLSVPFGIITCFLNNGDVISEKGFFYGYDLFICYLVLLQAGGGLVVALVVKYADNILKGFATSMAIIISCIASVYLFNFELTFLFVFGASLVICSIFMYGYQPKDNSNDRHLLMGKV
ncbi:hypothetical protein PV327_001223 [Microctonus hyperodae]|uniref:UDP-N-acetylglucosamine transporter n=1 Tax=Microctonus hyperodae TaxID=165561 RepID=A0AA39G8R8_MICHY|nr:hypothetical protein PV327_001223 [Microctonus hyperodae]